MTIPPLLIIVTTYLVGIGLLWGGVRVFSTHEKKPTFLRCFCVAFALIFLSNSAHRYLSPIFGDWIFVVCLGLDILLIMGLFRLKFWKSILVSVVWHVGFLAFYYLLMPATVRESLIPDAENAKILNIMASKGDDFSAPRDINFSFTFSNQHNAKLFFGQMVTMHGFKVEEPAFSEELKKWDITITTNMLPINKDITTLERSLGRIAESYSGEADGWGCLIVKKPE